MTMERKTLIIITLAVFAILVIIFFPKHCGNWGTSLEVTYKDCSCLGIKHNPPISGGASITCYGIPTSCSCYKLLGGGKRISVPCE